MTDQLLREGIALLKAGKRIQAKETLLKVIEQDEANEKAWLWLSGAVDNDEERRICLENVLTLNPSSEAARQGLAKLSPPVQADTSSAPVQRAVREQPDEGIAPAPLPQARQQTHGVLEEISCPNCLSPIDVRQNSGHVTCEACSSRFILNGHLCPQCGHYSREEQENCGQCGTPLRRTCPRCQTLNWAGNVTCGACDAELKLLEFLANAHGQRRDESLARRQSQAVQIRDRERRASEERHSAREQALLAKSAEIRQWLRRQRRSGTPRKELIYQLVARYDIDPQVAQNILLGIEKPGASADGPISVTFPAVSKPGPPVHADRPRSSRSSPALSRLPLYLAAFFVAVFIWLVSLLALFFAGDLIDSIYSLGSFFFFSVVIAVIANAAYDGLLLSLLGETAVAYVYTEWTEQEVERDEDGRERVIFIRYIGFCFYPDEDAGRAVTKALVDKNRYAPGNYVWVTYLPAKPETCSLIS